MQHNDNDSGNANGNSNGSPNVNFKHVNFKHVNFKHVNFKHVNFKHNDFKHGKFKCAPSTHARSPRWQLQQRLPQRQHTHVLWRFTPDTPHDSAAAPRGHFSFNSDRDRDF